MKKILLLLAATAALIAGCAKAEMDVKDDVDDGTSEETTPVVASSHSFVGSFAINGDETKATIGTLTDQYYVLWSIGDEIEIKSGEKGPYKFAVKSTINSGATAVFEASGSTVPTEDFYKQSSYTATFGQSGTSYTQEAGGSVKHIPMSATAGSSHFFQFEVTAPILAVTIPSDVEAKSMKIVTRSDESTAVRRITSSTAQSVFYIPMPAGDGEYFIKAYSDEEYSSEIAESMKMQTTTTLVNATLYPIEFTPTLEITAAGSYQLKKYPAKYNVRFRNDISNSVSIGYAEGAEASQKPAYIYIDAKNRQSSSPEKFTITNLTVNTDASHVEASYGVSSELSTITSKSTFVVKSTYELTNVTVKGGSITAEGKTDGSRNVNQITLDYTNSGTDMDGVVVSVAKVTSGNPVLIVNNTSQKEAGKFPINVVGTDNCDNPTAETGGYTIQSKKTDNIQKMDVAVARIGNNVYATLEAAVSAATAGQTIVLIDDIDYTDAGYIKVDKSVDINLNGHTITKTYDVSGTESGQYGYVIVYEAPDDNRISGRVYDGTINSTRVAVYAADNADVTVENLTVVQKATVTPTVFRHCALAASYGSTLNVKSGSYKGDAAAAVYTSGGIINITGGTFEGTEHAFVIYNPSNTDSGSNSELHVSNGQITGDCELPEGTPYGSYQRIVSYTGGIFTPDPSEYVADGYKASNIGANKWLVEPYCVAKIGEHEYATLADAFAAVKSGETITVVQDCETGSEYTTDKALALEVDNVTLDLNGCTITETKNFSFVIAGNNDIVKNGYVSSGTGDARSCGYNSYAMVVGAMAQGSKVTGVKIQDVVFTGGVSIGGSIDNKTADCKGYAEAEIEGCEITSGDYYCIVVQPSSDSKVTILSGSYKHFESKDSHVFSNDGCTISLKGGIYSEQPDASYVADGYQVVDNPDASTKTTYPYAVVSASYVARIGETYYTSLADAFGSVKSGETITVVRDCETGSEYTTDKALALKVADVTLDLNGYTITETKNFSFVIAGNNDIVKNGNVSSGTGDARSCGYNSYAMVVGAMAQGSKVTGVKIQDVVFTGGVSIGGSIDNNTADCKGNASVTMENCAVTSGNFYAIFVQPVNSDVTIASGKFKKHEESSSFLGVESSSQCTISLKGGIYSQKPDSKYVHENYQVIDNTDSETKAAYPYAVVEKPDVAQIGTTKYKSLEAAATAAAAMSPTAENKVTIELLDDITFDYARDSGADHVINLDNVILDLSNHTISAKNWAVVYQGDNMIVRNGNFSVIHESGKLGSYSLFIGDERATSNVVIENVSCTGGLNIYNTTAVIRGANMSGVSTQYYAVYADTDKPTVVTIESGMFTHYKDNKVVEAGSSTGIIIKGGTFTKEPDAAYVATGYAAVKDGDVWKVLPTLTGGTTKLGDWQ